VRRLPEPSGISNGAAAEVIRLMKRWYRPFSDIYALSKNNKRSVVARAAIFACPDSPGLIDRGLRESHKFFSKSGNPELDILILIAEQGR
jgi:hypothetical protein